jgi:quercetin dioxygenase-like cupin family protein
MTGIKQGKVWGDTKSIVENPFCELHHIHIDAGGVCSKHCHRFKTNGFYVLSGTLLIRTWQNDYDLVDETYLSAGDYHEVKPNLYHQFEAVTNVDALEIYFPTPIGHDIVRESVGHKKDDSVVSYKGNQGQCDSIGEPLPEFIPIPHPPEPPKERTFRDYKEIKDEE